MKPPAQRAPTGAPQPSAHADPRRPWSQRPCARAPSAAFLLASLAFASGATAQQLQRLSDPEDPLALGTLADGLSEHCRIAGGRWTVFSSRAANLVAGDRNASQDVFLRDRQTGQVERISVDSAGAEARGASLVPDVSDDGRYVVFQSQAALAPGATSTIASQIYLRDRASGTTTLVSRTFNGGLSGGSSLSPRIDGAGTTVVFASSVDLLVPGDGNNTTDIFAYDIASGVVSLVSSSAAGALADAPSRLPDVADGGRWVVFASDASNLVPGDSGNQRDVFLKDRTTGAIERLSVDAAGNGGDGFSDQPVIDATGAVVVFSSYAANFVPGDTLNRQDIFVWDASATPRLSRVNLGAGGVQANNHSRAPAIGNAGRWVVFDSAATNLVPGQIASSSMQPFVVDRQSGAIGAVLATAGQSTVGPATVDSGEARLCLSSTTAFAAEDANGPIRDVSSRGVASGDWGLESRSATPVPAPAGNGASSEPETSPDGRYLVFQSFATNLDAMAVGRASSGDVYWLDRDTGAMERWPLAPGGLPPLGGSANASVSADGRWIAFQSSATNLVAGSAGGVHVYRLDRGSGALLALTVVPAGSSGGGERPQMSDDGGTIVFQSAATGLVPGDTNGVRDVFLWREGQPLQRVSVPEGGGQADRESRSPRIAGQGGHVVFVSAATNLVAGASGGFDQVYRVELASGAVRRVSQTAGGVAGDAHSRVADVSADGRYVALVTDAGNLAAGGRGGPEVLRWDAQDDGFVDAAALLPIDEAVDPDTVRLSDDGRYVAFVSVRQVGSVFTENAWRADLAAGVLQLMSSDGGSNRNGGRMQGLAIDATGAVAFAADDDTLLAGDGNGAHDVYRAASDSAAGLVGLDPGASLLTVTEGTDPAAVVAIVRSVGIQGAVTANYETRPGSATSVLDFAIRTGIASFADGDAAAQLVQVPIVDDDLVEGPEQFTVTLTQPTGGAALGPTTTVTITIVDDDEGPPMDPVFTHGFED